LLVLLLPALSLAPGSLGSPLALADLAVASSSALSLEPALVVTAHALNDLGYLEANAGILDDLHQPGAALTNPVQIDALLDVVGPTGVVTGASTVGVPFVEMQDVNARCLHAPLVVLTHRYHWEPPLCG